jgi:uncharacterized protein (DUF1697 family)
MINVKCEIAFKNSQTLLASDICHLSFEICNLPLKTMQFISILRGINVSGHRKVPMADLKALYQQMGFTDVAIYIQSGNVVFKTNLKVSGLQLAQQIEKAIEQHFGFDVPVIIRSVTEWQHAIDNNPFTKETGIDTDKLHITFLAEEPQPEQLEAIKACNYPPDRFAIIGKEIYLHCPDSYGNTKLSNTFFESKLKVKATTRNWKTVNKLMEMAG